MIMTLRNRLVGRAQKGRSKSRIDLMATVSLVLETRGLRRVKDVGNEVASSHGSIALTRNRLMVEGIGVGVGVSDLKVAVTEGQSRGEWGAIDNLRALRNPLVGPVQRGGGNSCAMYIESGGILALA